MIAVTRLSGSAFVVNADLIERVDATPDTIITLVDGKKYVVTESLAEVVAEVRAHRASIIALSTRMAEHGFELADLRTEPQTRRLTAIPGDKPDGDTHRTQEA